MHSLRANTEVGFEKQKIKINMYEVVLGIEGGGCNEV